MPAEDTGSLRSSPALPELQESDQKAMHEGHAVGLWEKETRPPSPSAHWSAALSLTWETLFQNSW